MDDRGRPPKSVRSALKWLYPGMRVKRWLFLLGLGTVVFSVGASLALGVEVFTLLQVFLVRPLARSFGAFPQRVSMPLGIALAALGGGLIVIGVRQTIRSLILVFLPESADRLADIVFAQRQLRRGPHIVVIGGGTGLSTLLRGLKAYTSNITAIVTVADDGGSSGRLRNELGIPPPGDIRNTLVALADTEPLMERLFQHRFNLGEGLKGHSFGNLFIAAMCEVTGDFEEAVRESSKVLAIRGRVLPSTLQNVVLRAEFEDGSTVTGESAIAANGKRIRRVCLEPADASPLEEALEAIDRADAIILGPGSLYTSILPNLLVGGICDAVRRARAAKIYVCNVMTQPGETDGYGGYDHVKAIEDHVGPGLMKYVILNGARVSPDAAQKYEMEAAFPVDPQPERLARAGYIPIVEELVDDSDYVRHDPDRLAQVLMEVLSQSHQSAR